jgi:hypothetical protein
MSSAAKVFRRFCDPENTGIIDEKTRSQYLAWNGEKGCDEEWVSPPICTLEDSFWKDKAFHGMLSREKADEKLSKCPLGTYLIRTGHWSRWSLCISNVVKTEAEGPLLDYDQYPYSAHAFSVPLENGSVIRHSVIEWSDYDRRWYSHLWFPPHHRNEYKSWLVFDEFIFEFQQFFVIPLYLHRCTVTSKTKHVI